MRADGRTGYSRRKGREYTSVGTSYPRPLISRNSTITGALRFGWGSRTEAMSTSSDWKLEQRSVQRKVEGKRLNERALKMVTGTPWNPRPGEVVARRRYITRLLVERYGPTEDCGACFRKSQRHTERCRARFDLLCAGEDGPVEARAQEGSTRSSSTESHFNVNGSTNRWSRHGRDGVRGH